MIRPAEEKDLEAIGRIYDEVKKRPVYLVARDEDRSPLRDPL